MKGFNLIIGATSTLGMELINELPSNNTICTYNKNLSKLKKIKKNYKYKLNLKNKKDIDKITDNLKFKKIKIENIVLLSSLQPKLQPILDVKEDMLFENISLNFIGLRYLIKKFINKKISFENLKIICVLSKIIENEKITTNFGAYYIGKKILKIFLDLLASENPWIDVRYIFPTYFESKMIDNFLDKRLKEYLYNKNAIKNPNFYVNKILKEII